MPKRMLTRNWVLRVSSKERIVLDKTGTKILTLKPTPKFKTIVQSSGIHESSSAYWNFLSKWFKIKVKFNAKFDKSKDVRVIQYRVWSS